MATCRSRTSRSSPLRAWADPNVPLDAAPLPIQPAFAEPLAEYLAPPEWRSIDFISDIHLAEDTPRGFEAWSTYMHRTPADAVFILGDLFELWVGDDARHRGFEARCSAVLSEASARCTVAFLVGNRDFLVGEDMLGACGVRAVRDPTVLKAFGERVLLSHGDAWCVADTEYQKFRAQVRNPVWQRNFLTLSLEQRTTAARQVRAQSELRSRNQGPNDWVDVDRATALHWMTAAAAPTLVHGHTHRSGTETLAPGNVRHVLSDWDLDHSSESRCEVLRWKSDGFIRLSVTDAMVATSDKHV